MQRHKNHLPSKRARLIFTFNVLWNLIKLYHYVKKNLFHAVSQIALALKRTFSFKSVVGGHDMLDSLTLLSEALQ